MSTDSRDVADQALRLRHARWRTWLRVHTPNLLYDRFGFVVPKARDCGKHDWHNGGHGTDICYHCEVTRSTPPDAPWYSHQTFAAGHQGVTRPAAIAFCERLAERFPELGLLLAEHRQNNGGETLDHVFMADVARWFMDRWRAHDWGSVHGLADWLDDQYPDLDGDSRNVVDVSFLENLPWPPDPEAAVDRLLGPELRRTLTAIQKWRPDSPEPASPTGDTRGH